MVINLMFSLFELGSEIEQPTFKVILSCSEKTAATQPKLITINEKIINEKVWWILLTRPAKTWLA